MNKIKGQIGIDGNTVLILLILVFVAFGSFGLGRLSVVESPSNNNTILDNKSDSSVKEVIGKSELVENSMVKVDNLPREKMYVASKNGKLYYSLGCSGAKRISTKNEVWFASGEEAEKSGYTLSTSCN
ncbi:MAG: hypothetical protein WCW65_02015 [Candidatus Paceibacterota bacterium]